MTAPTAFVGCAVTYDSNQLTLSNILFSSARDFLETHWHSIPWELRNAALDCVPRDVGAPLSALDVEPPLDARATILKAADAQSSRVHSSMFAMRVHLLKQLLTPTSKTNAGPLKDRSKKVFQSDDTLHERWYDEVCNLKPTELVEVIKPRIQPTTNALLACACLANALAQSVSTHKGQYGAMVEVLETISEKLSSIEKSAPEAELSKVRLAVLTAISLMNYRPQDVKRLSGIAKRCAVGTKVSIATHSFECHYRFSAKAPSVDWVGKFSLPFASRVEMEVKTLEGDVNPATLIDNAGLMTDLHISTKQPTVFQAGTLFLSGSKGSQLEAQFKVSARLQAAASVASELVEGLSSILVKSAGVLVDSRAEKTDVSEILPLIRGGIADTARDLTMSVDAVMGKVRVRKASVGGVRAYTSALVAICGSEPEVVREIVAKVSVNSELVGHWPAAQRATVEWLAGHAVPTKQPPSVGTISDILIGKSLTKLSSDSIKEAVKERRVGAQKILLALDLTASAVPLLPQDHLTLVCAPLRSLLSDSKFAESLAGSGEELEDSVLAKIQQVLTHCFRTLRDAHREDLMSQKPHHFVKSERPYLSFAIALFGLVCLPGAANVASSAFVLDTLAAFFAPPNDFSRSASYRLDSEELDEGSSEAAQYLARIAESVALCDRSDNDFGKTTSINFASDGCALASKQWALTSHEGHFASKLVVFNVKSFGDAPMSIGLAPWDERSSVREGGFFPGQVLLSSDGQIHFFSPNGVKSVCSTMPITAPCQIGLAVCMAPSTTAECFEAAFFVNSQLLCRVPIHHVSSVAVMISSTKGSKADVSYAFGANPSIPLRDVFTGASQHPTLQLSTTAALRTLFVVLHTPSINRHLVVDKLVAGTESLTAFLLSIQNLTAPSVTEVSKGVASRWIAEAMLNGHLACLKSTLKHLERETRLDLLRVLLRFVTDFDAKPSTTEVVTSCYLICDEVLRGDPTLEVPELASLLESLYSRAGENVKSSGLKVYAPRWDDGHIADKLSRSDDGMQLFFQDKRIEHLAAYASPPVSDDGSVTFIVSRPAERMAFTYVGVGDLATSNKRFLGDYLQAFKDSKKHMYVLPALADDVRHVASFNSEELKRNKNSWATADTIYAPGDRITVSVNRARRTISFARNGQSLGVLFSNVTESPLHPFCALYHGDSSCTIEGVTIAALDSPIAICALTMLQTLCQHPGCAKDVDNFVKQKLQDHPAPMALKMLGSDGAANAVRLQQGNKKAFIVGGRTTVTGKLEAVFNDGPDLPVRSASWETCSPCFSVALPDASHRSSELAGILVGHIAEIIAHDETSVTVIHPQFVFRVMRLLASWDLSSVADDVKSQLLNIFTRSATLPCSTASGPAIIEAGWAALNTLSDEYIAIPTVSLAEEVKINIRDEARLNASCVSCGRPWTSTDCCGFIPLSIAEAAHASIKKGAPFSFSGDWVVTTLGWHVSLEVKGAIVAGGGRCPLGKFSVQGNIIAGVRMELRFSFEFASVSPVAQEAEPEAEWSCDTCTFLNAASASRCGMCNSGRAGANWACPVCTYAFNSTDTTSCGMCGTRREREAQATSLTAALTAQCATCGKTTEIASPLTFDGRCDCDSPSWLLSSGLAATFTGDLEEEGHSFSGTLSLKGEEVAAALKNERLQDLSNQCPSGVYVAPGIPRSSANVTVSPKTTSVLAQVYSWFAKKIVIGCLRSQSDPQSRQTRFATLVAVSSTELLNTLLPADLSPEDADDLVENCAKLMLSTPTLSAYRCALILCGVVVTRLSVSASAVNKALHGIAASYVVNPSTESRRHSLNCAVSILEHCSSAKALILSRVINVPTKDSPVVPMLAVLQSLRGGAIPNNDPSQCAASIILSAVEQMVSGAPVLDILDTTLHNRLAHLVPLPQTTMSAQGHLITGQVQGSIAARRSRKQKVYYEVEAPGGLRAVEVRMGWGTLVHARNSATYHVGSDGHSWAYNLKARVMCFSGESEYAPPFFVKEGDVIGSGLDLQNGTCWWSINGFQMAPINIDGLVEDDEIYPFMSASLSAEHPLKVRLSKTRFLPPGFEEFDNVLLAVGRHLSSVKPMTCEFYEALNAVLDEVASTGTSFDRFVAVAQGKDDPDLDRQLTNVVDGHHLIQAFLADHDDSNRLRAVAPYIQHLISISELSQLSSRLYSQATASEKLKTLVRRVRALVVLPARWSNVERIIERRVNRSQMNILRVEIDRKRSSAAYRSTSLDVLRRDTVLGQLYAQTHAKDVFNNLKMFNVAFSGSIAEDGGGLYRSCLSLIADEVMQNVVDDGAEERAKKAADEVESKFTRKSHLFTKNDHSTFFNAVPSLAATSQEDLNMFTWFGKLLGNITLTGSVVFAVNFPRLFWKFLVGEPISVENYFYDCCDSARAAIDDDDFVMDDDDFFGAIPTAKGRLTLAPNAIFPTSEAKRVAVLADRRNAAAEALVHLYDAHLQAIRDGFTAVVPNEALAEMTWLDLQRRVCGASEFTADDLFNWLDLTLIEESVANNLREAIKTMTAQQRSRLLLFCSGQTRLPLPEKVKVVCGDEPTKFPTAHTCSPITMVIQPYTTVQEFVRVFLVSMAHAYEYAFV